MPLGRCIGTSGSPWLADAWSSAPLALHICADASGRLHRHIVSNNSAKRSSSSNSWTITGAYMNSTIRAMRIALPGRDRSRSGICLQAGNRLSLPALPTRNTTAARVAAGL